MAPAITNSASRLQTLGAPFEKVQPGTRPPWRCGDSAGQWKARRSSAFIGPTKRRPSSPTCPARPNGSPALGMARFCHPLIGAFYSGKAPWTPAAREFRQGKKPLQDLIRRRIKARSPVSEKIPLDHASPASPCPSSRSQLRKASINLKSRTIARARSRPWVSTINAGILRNGFPQARRSAGGSQEIHGRSAHREVCPGRVDHFLNGTLPLGDQGHTPIRPTNTSRH